MAAESGFGVVPLEQVRTLDGLTLIKGLMEGRFPAPPLAEALAREMERSDRRLPCLIEVNTGEEPQKSGVLPTAADDFQDVDVTQPADRVSRRRWLKEVNREIGVRKVILIG